MRKLISKLQSRRPMLSTPPEYLLIVHLEKWIQHFNRRQTFALSFILSENQPKKVSFYSLKMGISEVLQIDFSGSTDDIHFVKD